MRSRLLGVVVLAAQTLTCESDDSGLTAEFLPAARTPAAKQVYLSPDDFNDDRVAVAVRVRDTDDINRADLVLVYDPIRVVFRTHSRGSLLEQAGGAVSYDVRETVPGQLQIQVIRTSGGTVSAGTDDPALVLLSFQVVQAGTALASFTASSSLSDATPAPLSGIAFFGGNLVGS